MPPSPQNQTNYLYTCQFIHCVDFSSVFNASNVSISFLAFNQSVWKGKQWKSWPLWGMLIILNYLFFSLFLFSNYCSVSLSVLLRICRLPYRKCVRVYLNGTWTIDNFIKINYLWSKAWNHQIEIQVRQFLLSGQFFFLLRQTHLHFDSFWVNRFRSLSLLCIGSNHLSH